MKTKKSPKQVTVLAHDPGFDPAEVRELADTAVAGFRAFLYGLAELAEKAYVEAEMADRVKASPKPPRRARTAPGRRKARG